MQCLLRMKRMLADRTVVAFARIGAVWIPGLILGYLLARSIYRDIGVYLDVAVSVRSSLIGAVISSSAVMMLSAILAKFLHWSCIYVIAFVEATMFSCFSCCCVWNFGSAGWLVCCLLLFSNCCAVLVLLYFWAHAIAYKDTQRRITLPTITIAIAIGFMDYLLISPFLASLFD